MHVLSVAQTYFPYLLGGGRPAKVRAIADGLAARGHRVTVLTAELGPMEVPADAGDFQVRPGRFGLEAIHGGVRVTYLRSAVEYRYVTLNPGVFAFCRAVLPTVDVAHIYGLYDVLGAVVAGYCRRLGVPYVVEPIGMFRPISRSILWKRAYHLAVGRRLIGGAARVVATSERERGELLAGGVPPERVVLRRNGVEGPAVPPHRGEFRARYAIPAHARLVLFLGRLVPKKSPDLLLRAFARVAARGPAAGRPWHLALVGPDEQDRFRAQLERLAVSLGVAGHVTFTGPIYGDDKWPAYRDADVFVLPSASENFGNTVAEALAVGTPAIVTDRCGIAEWLSADGGEGALVVPHDEEALAGAIAQLGSDEILHARLRAGAARVTARLGWEEPIRETEALYERLMPARAGVAVVAAT